MLTESARNLLKQRLLLGVTFAGAASVGVAPSADGDIWWHLAAGREMVSRGSLLWTDPFSVSAAGRPWIDVHWLFQLAVYAVHQCAGLAGLVWVKCALVGLGAVLLNRALPSGRSWARPLLLTLLLATLLAARSLLLLRPVIPTLVLLALFFGQLERFRRDGRAKHLWLLPLAQMLWANLQGLSALGPAVAFAYALSGTLDASFGKKGGAWWFAREGARAVPAWQHARALIGVTAACLVATCLTPFALRGAALPSLLLGRLLPTDDNVFSRNVAENVPPFVLEGWSGGEFWHLKWFIALFAVTTLLAGRRLRLSHALLLVGFLGLALVANRNMLLFYWMAAPLAALHAAPRLRVAAARFRTSGMRLVAVANLALVATLLGVSATALAREPTLSEPSPFRVPVESARRLATLPPGDVFSADHHGGYLIWKLYPKLRPYIDTRLVLRSGAEYAEYLGLADFPERFAAFQAAHHFSYVLLPVAFPERYQRLVAELYASPDWKLLFTDGSEVLFGRAEATFGVAAWDLSADSATDRILKSLGERFSSSPKLHAAARLHLATLQTLVAQTAQAERTLSGLDSAEAQALRARCLFAAGDLVRATRLSHELLARDRDDVQSLNLLALIALRRGELVQGATLLHRALGIAPFDSEATGLLAQLQETQR
jgi:hypothetical protein